MTPSDHINVISITSMTPSDHINVISISSVTPSDHIINVISITSTTPSDDVSLLYIYCLMHYVTLILFIIGRFFKKRHCHILEFTLQGLMDNHRWSTPQNIFVTILYICVAFLYCTLAESLNTLCLIVLKLFKKAVVWSKKGKENFWIRTWL